LPRTFARRVIWLSDSPGFLWPFRYGLPWYIAGLARPVGLGVILVGLMRDRSGSYREIIRKNPTFTARELMARAEAAASSADSRSQCRI